MTAFRPNVAISWPSMSHASVPLSRRITFGARSLYFAGRWSTKNSCIDGGSTTWSSTLIRIMSLMSIAQCLDSYGRVQSSDRERVAVVGPGDDAVATERVDRRRVVPELGEDLARVLAEARHTARMVGRRVGERDEVAELADTAEDRVLELGDQAQLEQLLVEQHGLAVPGVHRDLRRHARGVEEPAPVHREVV